MQVEAAQEIYLYLLKEGYLDVADSQTAVLEHASVTRETKALYVVNSGRQYRKATGRN